MAANRRLPIHFDPIRSHRAYGVPDRYEFVPNRTQTHLNIFDLATKTKAKALEVCGHPDVTATTIDGRYLYQAGTYLVAIDLTTLEVVKTYAGKGIGDGYAVNVFPDGKRMFYYNMDGSIAVLRNADDPFKLEAEHVIVVHPAEPPESANGGKGQFIAGDRRYINANWHKNQVFEIDLTDYSVRVLVPEGFSKPDDLVMAPDERKGYTASHSPGPEGGQDGVDVFDIVEGRVLRRIKVGRQPAGLTMSPDESIVYATNVPDGSVSAIDVATDSLLYTASAAEAYHAAGIRDERLDIEGVTVSQDGKTLYAYAVNFGALVIIEDLGSENRATVIPEK